MSRVNFKMEDGIEVIVSGRLSTYPANSRYQLNAERIEAAGAGALMELLLKRKAQLAKEGLFDQSKKKPIPAYPKKIGIITSPTGAVIMDMLHRIKDRWPVHILLWPVAVQGESCAFEVSSAINGFNRMDEDLRPDVLIVARGGGSIEDLWGFNEEIVVRAASSSGIPIISAIGHETDFTLIDFASSLRAPTPTAAAEFALPVLSDLKNKLRDMYIRCETTYTNNLRMLESKIALLAAGLKLPEKLLYPKQQILDELSFRLGSSLPNHLNLKLSSLASVKLPINAIHSLISAKTIECSNLSQRSLIFITKKYQDSESKLNLNAKLLDSLGIPQILKRGFAIVKGKDGLVTSKQTGLTQENVMIEWHDGKLKANIVKDA